MRAFPPGVAQSGVHHRKSVRLRGYDYSQVGGYFITICTFEKKCLLGFVKGDGVQLSQIGKIVSQFWYEIPTHFENVQLDAFVVMPNHIHGIIMIANQRRGVKFNAPTKARDYHSRISPGQGTIPVIVRTYKAAVSRWCNRNGYEPFRWQRNYYEHIVRGERDLAEIREYIVNNPLKWDLDNENPDYVRTTLQGVTI